MYYYQRIFSYFSISYLHAQDIKLQKDDWEIFPQFPKMLLKRLCIPKL
jgi:hypothetical protein